MSVRVKQAKPVTWSQIEFVGSVDVISLTNPGPTGCKSRPFANVTGRAMCSNGDRIVAGIPSDVMDELSFCAPHERAKWIVIAAQSIEQTIGREQARIAAEYAREAQQ